MTTVNCGATATSNSTTNSMTFAYLPVHKIRGGSGAAQPVIRGNAGRHIPPRRDSAFHPSGGGYAECLPHIIRYRDFMRKNTCGKMRIAWNLMVDGWCYCWQYITCLSLRQIGEKAMGPRPKKLLEQVDDAIRLMPWLRPAVPAPQVPLSGVSHVPTPSRPQHRLFRRAD